MPLVRRVPKRGFHNRFAPVVVNVNVGQLQQAFEDGQQVDAQSLRAKGLARSRWDVLKILGDGQLSKKLTVHAHRFSQSAREKIEQAGGQAVTVPTKVPVAEKQQAKGRESAGKSS
jgi:large subunit ribosomal protein L15